MEDEKLHFKEPMNIVTPVPSFLGFVLFEGTLSSKRDKQGFNIIDFNYKRENFSFADTRKAIIEFVKAYLKDDEGITREELIDEIIKGLKDSN